MLSGSFGDWSAVIHTETMECASHSRSEMYFIYWVILCLAMWSVSATRLISALESWWLHSDNVYQLNSLIYIQVRTRPTELHPSGHIVSNVDELLELFDAEFGALVIGGNRKLFGNNKHEAEVTMIIDYLQLQRFRLVQLSLVFMNSNKCRIVLYRLHVA